MQSSCSVLQSHSLHFDNDLADESLPLKVLVGLLSVLKLEHLVDKGLNVVGFDSSVHRFKLRLASNSDPARDEGLVQRFQKTRGITFAHEADEADDTFIGDRVDAMSQRSSTGNVDDVIKASRSERPCSLAPLVVGLVVDNVIHAEVAKGLSFVVGRCCGNDTSAGGFGKLRSARFP